ncbi:AAA family ATPase [Desulfallas sp. Bu1-1]|uniref:AAA family ATPase n=1 Tax=Desulfallas sp. Bu1-1 TaxID=2787620 RepID=UPI00189DA3F1|nr:AAA family ATPase [Desulfallas sp. Bu1-1]MBF7084431.1 AAA family ATPase [Desulfallas sp. Bu1-1]
MKPVELRLSGLHSYREQQAVDFDGLCERGIFGIFGPTGSGKSTILDAITLALFGDVKRATGYQGVINQREDQARVAFTFEVGRGDDRRRYRVERTLRRSGDFGAHTRDCRLVRVDPGGERVLADKDGQVRAMVQELLGLTADDFTRAVVLPQGRFAEFLALKPAERRQMLERLFELDRFGEQLKKRVVEVKGRVQAHLERVEAEQQGLGDCSPGALENARRELEHSRAERRRAAGHCDAVRKKLEEARAVRELQAQRDALENRLVELRRDEPGVRRAGERLEAATRAEGLRGLLEEGERLERDLAGRKDRLAGLAAEAGRLERLAGEADQKARQLRQARESREPQLLSLHARLEGALAGEAELDDMLEREKTWQDELAAREKEITQLKARKLELQNTVEQQERRLAELKNRLEGLLLSPEEEERASRIFDLYREVTRLAEEAGELAGQRGEAEGELARLGRQENTLDAELKQLEAGAAEQAAALQRLRENPPVPGEELERRAVQLEQWRHRAERLQELAGQYRDLDREHARRREEMEARRQERETRLEQVAALQRELEGVEREQEELSRRVEEVKRRNLAAYLARTLEPGQACPVCGSTHHPAPAPEAVQELDELERALAGAGARAKELRRELSEGEGRVERLDGELAALAALEDSILQGKGQVREEGRRLRGELPQTWREARVADLPGLLREMEQQHRLLQEAVRDWERQVEETRERERELRRRLDQLRPALARVQSDRENRRRQLEDIARREAGIAAKQAALNRELLPHLAAAGLKAPADVPGYRESIGNRQAECRRCREAIQQLEPQWKSSAEQLQQAGDSLRELEFKASALREKLADLQAQINRRRSELEVLTGGRRVKQALEQVRGELDSLREAAARAEEQSKQAFDSLHRARLKLEGENKTCAALQEQLDNLGRKLEQAALRARFAGAGEARDALLDPGEREELARLVEEYRRQEQLLTSGLRDLEARLGGRSVDDAGWRVIQEQMREAEGRLGLAQQREGAAENRLSQLEQRRDRWNALEKDRRQLSRRRELLGELEGVLRGRALVEFMARRRLESLVTLASERLGRLTGYRYALELDGQGGFVLRDEADGGLRRPVFTLSGGETFLASLALALALSDQIQRRGRAPLEFFFLDEGFGSLDERYLEVVMDTLERLPLERMAIGLISHVPQLVNRLPRRLVVEPARPDRGSVVRLERA